MPRTGRPPVPAIDRFTSKYDVDPITGCWVWQAATYHDRGYVSGQFYDGSRNVRAHRFAWEYAYGVISEGLQLYRTCPTELCVNPAHHETGVANRLYAEKTACPSGHPYSKSNTVINSANGGRQCRTCLNESSRRSLARPVPYWMRRKGRYRDDLSTPEIITAYAMGDSLRQIAADMNTSRPTIRRRLRAVGAPVRVAG